MKIFKFNNMKRLFSASLVSLMIFAGCERSVDGLDVPSLSQNPDVFIDGFSAGLEYFPYDDGFAFAQAFSVDQVETFGGSSASMRFDVPNPDNALGNYVGAFFLDENGGRDLSPYNALTFYAKGTLAGKIDQIGFGQGPSSNFQVSIDNLHISTNWKKYVIPIPDASKLTQEEGMLWLVETQENGNGYTFWIDELKFEYLPGLIEPQPFISNRDTSSASVFVGQDFEVRGLGVTVFNTIEVEGRSPVLEAITVNSTFNYFDFSSSDANIATVIDGVVTVTGGGSATITGSLGGVEAEGAVELESIDFAPTPTRAAADVISIFSDAYTNSPVNYFNGYWAPFQTTQGQDDIEVNGNNVIKYSELNFVGTEFTGSNSIDGTEMTHFHIDVYIENTLQPGDFIDIRIVDFGPNGVFGGDDSETTFRLSAGSSPRISNNGWISIDIPLSSLATKANLSQIVFVTEGTNPNATGSITDILIDNMYFYK